MTTCVTANYLDVRSIYPVLDPRRTAGPGPYSYGYGFASDFVQIDVERNPSLTTCQMMVKFTQLSPSRQVTGVVTWFDNGPEGKEIQAYNMGSNRVVSSVGTASLGFPSSMTIQKATCPSGSGVDTVILCRYFAWPRGRTALYTFDAQDFWDFWGGYTVTFNWLSDTGGSNLWGNQTPPPRYPLVKAADGTLVRSGADFHVVFGGTGFLTDAAYRAAIGLNTATAIPALGLPTFPADGTLLREVNQGSFFVVYGGAKFSIANLATLFSLGLDSTKVKVVPVGGTSRFATMPIDGTLLMEPTAKAVHLAQNGKLRWVTSTAAMSANCLSWRHVRTVPDNSLATLPFGPTI